MLQLSYYTMIYKADGFPAPARTFPGPAAPGSCPDEARQEKTLKKWGQLYVFSTCMTIKAEIRSSPARMPRKSPDRGPDGIRHGQDPKSEDSCTFSVPPRHAHRGPRQRPGRSPAAPGSCPAEARQEKTFKKWAQLHVFSTCMTIKAEIRSSPARMPRKNPDKGPDGFRQGQDPKSEDS